MAERSRFDAPKDSPVIYTGWSGYDIRKFSYTMASDMDKCGVYVKQSRIIGLEELERKAALEFGICMEEALKIFYTDDVAPEKIFDTEWGLRQDMALSYGKREGSWADLNRCGRLLWAEFHRLRKKKEIKLTNPEFSVVLPRDVDETWHEGSRLEYTADVISHPKKGGDVLVDVKTSAQSYPEFVQLDPQLRTGSLLSGIRNVAFLVFVKTRTPKIQYLPGYVTPELVEGVDSWLKEMYAKYRRKEFVMRAGIRFPNNQCTMCKMLPVCLGDKEEVERTLQIKQKKEVEESLAAMDEI